MIPINRPIFDEQEEREALAVMRSGRLSSSGTQGGEKVRRFEESLAKWVGTKFAVAMNSGTSALLGALLASGVKPGDEILVPSFTFVATANAVLLSGASPVFVDVNMQDYTMDPKDLREKLTGKSKVVMPVHLYGYPARMKEILEIAEQKSLFVVEDAAQSLGATFDGKQTGSLGDVGCFSFYPSKIISCGEGGAVTTNNEEIGGKLRMIRNHGMAQYPDTRMLGLNLRMPEMEAAIGWAQLGKLRRFLEVRRANATTLTNRLEPAEELKLPVEEGGRRGNWYLYTIAVKRNRNRILGYLRKRGVGAEVYYPTPVNRTPYYEALGFSGIHLPRTEMAAMTVISLPVHPGLTKNDLDGIADAVNKASRSYLR